MNKDILFSVWYDSLEGTKSQGFAYKAWCAGWEASQKESTLQEISDIGQWDTSDMAHRAGGLSVEQAHTDHPLRHWDRTCPACVAEAEKQEPEKEKESTSINVDPRVLLGRNSYFTKNIENRLCDLERRMAKIETQPAPPKREWIGLTDEEVHEAAIKCVKSGQSVNAAIRAIEAKLRERNT